MGRWECGHYRTMGLGLGAHGKWAVGLLGPWAARGLCGMVSCLGGGTQGQVLLCDHLPWDLTQAHWHFWLCFPTIKAEKTERPCRLTSSTLRGRQLLDPVIIVILILLPACPCTGQLPSVGLLSAPGFLFPPYVTLLLGCTLEGFPLFLGPPPS